MTCKHTKTIGGCWVPNPYYDAEEDSVNGYSGDSVEWEESWEQPTTEDINLHQYKCTQCGKVFSY